MGGVLVWIDVEEGVHTKEVYTEEGLRCEEERLAHAYRLRSAADYVACGDAQIRGAACWGVIEPRRATRAAWRTGGVGAEAEVGPRTW